MINEKGEEVGIIYGWYNTLTDMWYVGQTVEPENRFNSHIRGVIDHNDNNYFHRALRKYGLDNFVYCVLEENILRANLNLKEQEWIEEFESFESGYNMTAGGGQTIFSVEMKKKMSESHKGKHFSEEHRKNLSNAFKGKHLSDETKKKLSNFHKGKHLSDETKKKLSNILKGKTPWNVGQHLSDEHRKNLSNALKGSKNPMYAKHHSMESRRKMSVSRKGKKLPQNRKPVSKYDLNGNFIKKYDSIKDAIKENPKAGHIGEVCKGNRKQAGGFIWKYAS